MGKGLFVPGEGGGGLSASEGRLRASGPAGALFVVLKPARSLRVANRWIPQAAGAPLECKRCLLWTLPGVCPLTHTHAHEVTRTQKKGNYKPICLQGAGGLASDSPCVLATVMHA